MKNVVCFSGGHSSAIAAIETVRLYGKENVILLNHDISSEVEHADIKRFKQEISDYLDLPITYASMIDFEKITPLKLCRKIGAFQVQAGQALCTYNLKTKPFYDWLYVNYPATNIENIREDITIIYGFDSTEHQRIIRRSQLLGIKGYKTEFPLIWKNRTIWNTEEIGIKRPITYKLFNHANCQGCLKAGRQHWYIIYCLRPDLFKQALEAEDEIGYSIIKGVYMRELLPIFDELKSKNICPNEHEQSQSFWARVREIIPEQQSFLPCDCAVL